MSQTTQTTQTSGRPTTRAGRAARAAQAQAKAQAAKAERAARVKANLADLATRPDDLALIERISKAKARQVLPAHLADDLAAETIERVAAWRKFSPTTTRRTLARVVPKMAERAARDLARTWRQESPLGAGQAEDSAGQVLDLAEQAARQHRAVLARPGATHIAAQARPIGLGQATQVAAMSAERVAEATGQQAAATQVADLGLVDLADLADQRATRLADQAERAAAEYQRAAKAAGLCHLWHDQAARQAAAAAADLAERAKAAKAQAKAARRWAAKAAGPLAEATTTQAATHRPAQADANLSAAQAADLAWSTLAGRLARQVSGQYGLRLFGHLSDRGLARQRERLAAIDLAGRQAAAPVAAERAATQARWAARLAAKADENMGGLFGRLAALDLADQADAWAKVADLLAAHPLAAEAAKVAARQAAWAAEAEAARDSALAERVHVYQRRAEAIDRVARPHLADQADHRPTIGGPPPELGGHLADLLAEHASGPGLSPRDLAAKAEDQRAEKRTYASKAAAAHLGLAESTTRRGLATWAELVRDLAADLAAGRHLATWAGGSARANLADLARPAPVQTTRRRWRANTRPVFGPLAEARTCRHGIDQAADDQAEQAAACHLCRAEAIGRTLAAAPGLARRPHLAEYQRPADDQAKAADDQRAADLARLLAPVGQAARSAQAENLAEAIDLAAAHLADQAAADQAARWAAWPAKVDQAQADQRAADLADQAEAQAQARRLARAAIDQAQAQRPERAAWPVTCGDLAADQAQAAEYRLGLAAEYRQRVAEAQAEQAAAWGHLATS